MCEWNENVNVQKSGEKNSILYLTFLLYRHIAIAVQTLDKLRISLGLPQTVNEYFDI